MTEEPADELPFTVGYAYGIGVGIDFGDGVRIAMTPSEALGLSSELMRVALLHWGVIIPRNPHPLLNLDETARDDADD